MRLEIFLIGLVTVSIFMIGGALIYQDMMVTYGEDPDMSYFNGSQNSTETKVSSYATMHDIYEVAEDANKRTIGDDSDVGEDNTEDSLFRGGYSALILLGRSFKLMNAITTDIGALLGVPGWIIKAIMTITTLLILFAIIYMVFRYKP